MPALIKTEIGFTRAQLDQLDEQAAAWGVSRASAVRVMLGHWVEWRNDPEGVDLPDRLRQPRRPL